MCTMKYESETLYEDDTQEIREFLRLHLYGGDKDQNP